LIPGQGFPEPVYKCIDKIYNAGGFSSLYVMYYTQALDLKGRIPDDLFSQYPPVAVSPAVNRLFYISHIRESSP
jgi:hypothetical protein